MVTRMLSTKTSITAHSFWCAHIVCHGHWPFGKRVGHRSSRARSVWWQELVVRGTLGARWTWVRRLGRFHLVGDGLSRGWLSRGRRRFSGGLRGSRLPAPL